MEKKFIAVVQCHLVKQRCSGYLCERAFHQRLGGFERYPAAAPLRSMHLTCGGCCGRPVQRKLANLLRQINKREGIERDQVVVQLSSCITKDNHHGPPCPHLDYLETLIGKLGVDVVRGTVVSKKSAQLRAAGCYAGDPGA